MPASTKAVAAFQPEQGNGSTRAKQTAMTSNWFDLAILGWLTVGALKGLASGLIRSGMRIAAFLLAAGLFYPVAQSLGGRIAGIPGLADRATSWFKRSGALPDDLARLPASDAAEYMGALMTKLNLPTSGLPVMSPGSSLEEYVARVLLQILLGFVIFIAFLGVAYVVADIAGAALQTVLGRLPLVGLANRIGGAALGLGEHTVIAALVVGLAAPILGSFPEGVGSVIKGSGSAEPLLTLFGWLAGLVGL